MALETEKAELDDHSEQRFAHGVTEGCAGVLKALGTPPPKALGTRPLTLTLTLGGPASLSLSLLLSPPSPVDLAVSSWSDSYNF